MPIRFCCSCASRPPWFIAALLFAAGAVQAQDVAMGQLRELSLEELSNLRITSVSKRAERLSDAPASVFVITGDDIRGSGASTLPEALRLAPNLHVSRVSAGEYLVTARGFNASNANKMLVLIDILEHHVLHVLSLIHI